MTRRKAKPDLFASAPYPEDIAPELAEQLRLMAAAKPPYTAFRHISRRIRTLLAKAAEVLEECCKYGMR